MLYGGACAGGSVAQLPSSSDGRCAACCVSGSCDQRRFAAKQRDLGSACYGHFLCFYLLGLRFSELMKGCCRLLSPRMSHFGDLSCGDGAGGLGQLVLACSVIKSFQVTWLGFFCMHSCVEKFRRENRRLRDYVRSLTWSPFGEVRAPSGASCLDLF